MARQLETGGSRTPDGGVLAARSGGAEPLQPHRPGLKRKGPCYWTGLTDAAGPSAALALHPVPSQSLKAGAPWAGIAGADGEARRSR